MSIFYPPPPPIAPPPSRETDLVFGTLLIITGLLVLGALGFVLWRQFFGSAKSSPSADDEDGGFQDQDTADIDAKRGPRLAMNIPVATLTPLRPARSRS